MRSSTLRVLAPMLLAAGIALVASQSAPLAQQTDAISREFTVFNDTSDSVATDAITREISVFNDLNFTFVVDDAITRELSVFNDRTNPVQITDAISREFTEANLLFNAWSVDLTNKDFHDLDLLSGLVGLPLAIPSLPTATTLQLDAIRGQEKVYGLLGPGIGTTRVATINPASGIVTSALVTAYDEVRGLAVDPFTADIYVGYAPVDTVNFLGFLSPNSGAIAPLGRVQFQPTTGSGGEIDLLAFAPNGILYAIENLASGMKLWSIDKFTLVATEVGVTSTSYSNYDDMAFLGGDLWAVNQGSPGTAILIDKSDAAVIGSISLPLNGLAGIAPASCVLAGEGILAAADTPNDAGGSITLDWSSYAAPGSFDRYEIVRSLDPCVVEQRIVAPLDSVLVVGEKQYVDTSIQDFQQYFYRIDVFVTGGAAPVDQFFGGPAVSTPNLLINEFDPDPAAGNPGQEVEIRNLNPAPINLTGYRISNGPAAPIPGEEVIPGGFAPGGGLFVAGLSAISLREEGGRVLLLPPGGIGYALDDVRYGDYGLDPAPTIQAPFSTGRVEGTFAEDPDGSSFDVATASFGQDNESVPPELGTSVVINEVFFNGPANTQYIELFNPQPSLVSLDSLQIASGANFTEIITGIVMAPGDRFLLMNGVPGSFQNPIATNSLYLRKILDGNLIRVDELGWGGENPPSPAYPLDALVRVPDGTTIYDGVNYQDSGGGVFLKYGLKTPGQANRDPDAVELIVDAAGGGDHTTIAAAVNAAVPGTRILVRGGNYSESFVMRDSLEIVGAAGDADSVLVTGVGGKPALTIPDSLVLSKISGLTFSGGEADTAGAVLVLGSAPEFVNVGFKFNWAKDYGGAVAILGGTPTFTGCLFYANRASKSGAAVAVLDSAVALPVFDSCLFVRNEATRSGGVVYAEAESTMMTHVVMDRNSARGAQGNDDSILHSSGGAIDVSYFALTESPTSAAVIAKNGGAIYLNCGTMYQAGPVPSDDPPTVVQVLNVDPEYCQPAALNYSINENSPLLSMGCAEIAGLGTAPCNEVTTDVPSAPQVVTRLHRATPNPFNPKTRLRFDLATAGSVDLTIYDLRGRRVRTLVGGVALKSGTHDYFWTGDDDRGAKVASGVYFARLVVNRQVIGRAQRMVLVK